MIGKYIFTTWIKYYDDPVNGSYFSYIINHKMHYCMSQFIWILFVLMSLRVSKKTIKTIDSAKKYYKEMKGCHRC